MPQAFQARKFFIPKTDPKQEVYKPVPYYFGTLSTQDAADQIAEESSLTKGDVLNVLDRYQRYVIKNLQKGYKVELLGFGTVYNRFVTEKGVATAPEVKATHIRTIVPGFSPSYTILNGARRYSLLGEKTSLLKVTILGTPVEAKVTKRSRLTLTGYFETYARCRIPTRFAQTGMLRALAAVSSLDARPLRPSKGKPSFPLISAGIPNS
ncbi:MAG: HU family DNA-binding protein [Parabacteroides sp.]|uniref:HU family DNA-binding protein n=1 Tax=Parabacteroides sp. TaxID=1869337 RepID=UPI002904FC27|nr:HU family DNA-binding protein [Parabacteroides sp.]MDU1011295.1 HU family DNA-binding protein [Parabacteroides sp.]